MKQRNQAIDILKGIGIILVLVAHSLEGFISQFAYTFHMPLFFIVTGLFISDFRQEKDIHFYEYLKCAVRKDFKRLIYPALFTTVCIILVSLLYFIFPDSYLCNPTELIYEPRPSLWGDNIKLLGNLWFLYALFFGKLFFYVVRNFTSGRWLLIVSFMTGGLAIVSKDVFTLPFCVITGLSVLPYISIGYIVKKRGGIDKGLPKWTCALIALWGMYIFYGKLYVGSMVYTWGYVPDVMAACGGTFFFYLIQVSQAQLVRLYGFAVGLKTFEVLRIIRFCGRYKDLLGFTDNRLIQMNDSYFRITVQPNNLKTDYFPNNRTT